MWFVEGEYGGWLVQTNSKLTHALNKLFAQKLLRFSTLIEEVSLNDAKKRLVKFLLDMHNNSVAKVEKDNILLIPFTREEIAQRIGTTRETVARQLHRLKRLKLIDIRPKQVIIRNKEGLEKLIS